MTPCAPFATTYGETLEYPCGLYVRSIVLPPGKATLPTTVTVSIPAAEPTASRNFGEPLLLARGCVGQPRALTPRPALPLPPAPPPAWRRSGPSGCCQFVQCRGVHSSTRRPASPDGDVARRWAPSVPPWELTSPFGAFSKEWLFCHRLRKALLRMRRSTDPALLFPRVEVEGDQGAREYQPRADERRRAHGFDESHAGYLQQLVPCGGLRGELESGCYGFGGAGCQGGRQAGGHERSGVPGSQSTAKQREPQSPAELEGGLVHGRGGARVLLGGGREDGVGSGSGGHPN